MYVWYKSKNILTLVTIGYIVGFLVGMYIEYCLWAQVAVLNHKLLYWTVWDRFMQVLYLGRAPHTKETLPDFHEKCRVTRHSRVFRGLTGSQRTPGIWGVTDMILQVQGACEGTARPRDRRLEGSQAVALMYTCIRTF